jgi:hypothetical protein
MKMDELLDSFENLNVIHSLNVNKELHYLIDILDDYEKYDDTLVRYSRYTCTQFFKQFPDIIARLYFVLDNKYNEIEMSHVIYNLDMDIYYILGSI